MTDNSEKWGVILNPKSGNKKASGKITISDILKKNGIDGIFRFTEYAGHASKIVHELVDQGIRKFIIVGGDGSVSEAIDGMMTANIDSRNLCFGIVPSGTGNDWCRYWGISKDINNCINMIKANKTACIDIGKLTYQVKRKPVSKYFINSVGIGYDAQVVSNAEKFSKLIKGQSWNYLLSLFTTTVLHRSKDICLSTDEKVLHQEKVFSMSIANGPFTGGGIKQTPDAAPDDGVFDIMVATKPTFIGLAKALHSILSKKYEGASIIHYYKTPKLYITGAHRHPVEADGIMQKNAKTPMELEIIPLAINMIIP